ncbi:Hpt domain-containing protein [Idiomarina aminovorans]|uniref:Hpt domain-containing protein n=1 Tax=Idiomarina aminovorans TaxID=2914829 RepID=UPI0020029AD2|nr:Hpt domain-containing protein [Idiomarina sp. ATCH4]MCK7459082.1 Hpt domain-containing protein [Idiomarina sp. ATCH4]
MTEKSAIDTELLQQYLDTLGVQGIQSTLTTFDGIIQGYAKLLHQAAKSRNEDELRKQAHKVKGACSSIGLTALAKMMEEIEKENWEWPVAERKLIEWADAVIPHRQQIDAWLAKHH